MSVKPEFVAVYGNLRRGGNANKLMEGCTFVCTDCVAGKLYDLGDNFPVAKINAAGFAPVTVDVYRLPNEVIKRSDCLTRIDRFEGYIPSDMSQSLFTRRRTLTVGRTSHWVWCYDYNHPVEAGQLVDSGDWMQRGPVRYLADHTMQVESGKEPLR